MFSLCLLLNHLKVQFSSHYLIRIIGHVINDPQHISLTFPYLFGEIVWPLGGKALCSVEGAIGGEAQGLGGALGLALGSHETEGNRLSQPPFPDV